MNRSKFISDTPVPHKVFDIGVRVWVFEDGRPPRMGKIHALSTMNGIDYYGVDCGAQILEYWPAENLRHS